MNCSACFSWSAILFAFLIQGSLDGTVATQKRRCCFQSIRVSHLGKANLRLSFPTELPRWLSWTGSVTHRATGREHWMSGVSRKQEGNERDPAEQLSRTNIDCGVWQDKDGCYTLRLKESSLSFVCPQTLHEAQAGRRRWEAGRGDGGRHAHHDLCVCGHVLQHAGAPLLLLWLPGYGRCTRTTLVPTHSDALQCKCCTFLVRSSFYDQKMLKKKNNKIKYLKCFVFFWFLFHVNGLWVYLSWKCYICVTWWRNSKMLCLGFSPCIKVVTARTKNNPLLGLMYPCQPQQLKIWLYPKYFQFNLIFIAIALSSPTSRCNKLGEWEDLLFCGVLLCWDLKSLNMWLSAPVK